jgi:predicted ATP-dependent endonuclease of OLD family
MTKVFDNKIQRLELENFTCFSKANLEFSSGINVFIGENGTGKTHVLKVLYALNTAVSKIEIKQNTHKKEYKDAHFNPYNFIQDLAATFGTGVWLDFIRENEQEETSFIADFDDELQFGLKFKNSELSNIILTITDTIAIQKPLFIPPYEMLSTIGGGRDKTYFDLITSLNSKKNGTDMDILKGLQELINIKVTKENDIFYIKHDDDVKTKAQLAANGINKIGQLVPLIQNGWLTKKTVLFWDEPEVNLNPRYIKIVAQFLQILAQNGVQVFVATHDYLLTYLLSLSAEYPQMDTPDMRFFSFYKGENGTQVEWTTTMNGIKNNAILEEYGAYHDLMMLKAFESVS